jgi:hypothetical protein
LAGAVRAARQRIREMLEQPRGAGARERFHDVTLILLDPELHAPAGVLDLVRLIEHRVGPIVVLLADVHVDAQMAQGLDRSRVRTRKITRQTRHGQKIHGISRCHVEGAHTTVRYAGDMEFAALDAVPLQQ